MASDPELVQNYTGLCCCCLQLSCPKTLWAEYSWMVTSEVYGDMLRECFGLEFPRPEEMETEQICEVCITRLRSAYKFKRQVAQCWSILNSRLPAVQQESTVQIKIEIDNDYNIHDVASRIKSDPHTNYDDGPELDQFVQDYVYNNGTDSDDGSIQEEDPIETKPILQLELQPQTNNRTDHRTEISQCESSTEENSKQPAIVSQMKHTLARDNGRRVTRKANKAPKCETLSTRCKAKARTVHMTKTRKLFDKESRVNACLLIQYSTIYPFKVTNGYFDCFYCPERFGIYDELTDHCNKLHKNVSIDDIAKSVYRPTDKIKVGASNITCKICSERIDDIEKLIEHLKKKHDLKFNNEIDPKHSVVGYDLENGKFRCIVCKEVFVFFRTLACHMNKHSTDHICDVCGKSFLTVYRLTAHKKVHSSQSSKCHICSKVYASERILKRHIEYGHSRKSLQCRFCEKVFESLKLMRCHQIEEHGIVRPNLVCDVCQKEFHTNSSLKVHKRNVHLELNWKTTATAANAKTSNIKNTNQFNKESRINACLLLQYSTIYPFKVSHGTFDCFYCQKHFVTYDELTEHCNNSHSSLTYDEIAKHVHRPTDKINVGASHIVCKLCKENVDNIQKLIDHLVAKHNVKFNYKFDPSRAVVGYDLEKGKFRCVVCGEEFLFFKTLACHMNNHSVDHICETCGKCFLTIYRLRSHTKVHSSESIECPICSKIYASEDVLKNHIKYTHNRKSHACRFCDETFKTLEMRRCHQAEEHGGNRPNLTCDKCSKEFLTNSALKMHIKSKHLGFVRLAQFQCDICNIMFPYKHKLRDHMYSHTGKKEHECSICNKLFSRLKSLREHMKIHNNDKRWSCASCGHAFVQKCTLKNHIRVHHGDLNGDELIVYKKPDKVKVTKII